jgi:hypothetical protein
MLADLDRCINRAHPCTPRRGQSCDPALQFNPSSPCAAPPTVRALLRAIGRIASGSHAASSGPGILELARPISFLLMACDPNIQEIPKAVPGRAKKTGILRAAATRENDRTNLRMNSLVTIFRNYQLVFAFCSGTMRHRTRAGFCMLISADRCRDL